MLAEKNNQNGIPKVEITPVIDVLTDWIPTPLQKSLAPSSSEHNLDDY